MLRTPLFVVVAILLGFLIITIPAAYMHAALPLFNSAPTAVGDSYTLHGNGTIGSLLANDSDPDPGDTLSASLVTSPTNGSLSNVGNGNFSYTRNSSTWTGTDSFTYKACDNQSPRLCSAAVTVNITVANQAPVAVNDIYNIHGATEIGPYAANDSDPDGRFLQMLCMGEPSGGDSLSLLFL